MKLSNRHRNQTVRLEIRFASTEWIDRIAEASRLREQSMNGYVRRAIRDALKRDGIKEPAE